MNTLTPAEDKALITPELAISGAKVTKVTPDARGANKGKSAAVAPRNKDCLWAPLLFGLINGPSK